MISIQLCCRSLSTHLHHLYSLPTGPFSSFRISLSSLSQVITKRSAQNAHQENPVLLNYLINKLDFPKPKALAISNRLHWVRSVEKPELTVNFFKSIGFTDPQIQSAVYNAPQILAADIEKILKPKIQLLQELGITSSDLGRLVSTKAVILLTRSLDRILKPSIEVLNKVLIKGPDNGDWFRVLRRCDWVIYGPPHLRLVPNISYLQSVGIVGSQLSSLLKRQPHLFAMPESRLKQLVSELMDIGFSTDSRMLVHGLHTLSSMSQESMSRKLLLLQSSGLSKSECMVMFRRAPALFRVSEKKIRLGLEFFLEKVKLKNSTLVQYPTLLMFSMEERVIPRYQVFQLIKSKKLMKKDPHFYDVMRVTEQVFLEKYVSRFTENAEELLKAYKGHRLDLGEE
ncbi:transcription termination factor MTERF5, chloroplastic-like [Solanum dulcamara]|uniref:transcription termination factor MTERF5, chloroplastic-like n=1 Tax=Solanum dulcamara TaxID=45834 RepID=UPI0024857D44|nr:transcription termination factor MTERF5, chloroplastic-like [Solanum dulcamara]XP_055801636.1 transcription termination factor MTERF5, chloroplastic-like [Solanum dulcamara]XP_055801637.1 transcription termination factor MTERF5, chloroplastic-like [Solanum dulcamara]XP_055801638.1 transcription termination factor MTERF5, chloroplastic-like [Solanum dulcamara]XP_055801639.1 transcription termination factor MTERF5, chloroplastic-like [Solanum dulcamara]